MGTKVNAVIIALEHRYFGSSQPFDNSQGGFSVDNLKWLTTKQALADTAAFIDYISSQYGNTKKFLLIGGSYPGAFVAWFKNLYPDHAEAIWSSSGVVEAKAMYDGYDLDLYLSSKRSMNNCAQRWAMVSADIERKLKYGSAEERQNITTHFGEPALVIRNEDVMSFIGDLFAGSVQNGLRTKFCDMINNTMWFDNYMNLIQEWNSQYIGSNLTEYTLEYFQNTTIDYQSAHRSWNWLICNEFGYFQGPNNLDYPIHSQMQNLTYYLDFCQNIFYKEIPPPQIDASNAYYGGYKIKGDNILFVTSSEDPWQFVGMRYLHDPDGLQKGSKAHYVNCPDCSHCVDLRSPSPSDAYALNQTRTIIDDTIM